MKRSLSCILLLCVLLSALSVCAAEEDPVAVRVGDFTYPLSLVQGSLDSALKLDAALSDEDLSDDERGQLAADIIDNFVGIGLIEAKLTEAGQHDFTPDEVETLKTAARNRYEELWQGLYRSLKEGNPEITEEQVTQDLEEEGYTQDAIYREYEVSERQHRAIDLFVPDMMLTEAQLDEYYETQLVAPDRERYSGNIPLYEQEILAANNASFYTPEGYRNIRQILLEYPEEVETALKPFRARAEEAAKEVGEAYIALADAAAKAEDWSELDAPRAEYDEAAEGLRQAADALADERKKLTMPLIRDTLDAIDERLDAGIDFGALITKYSADVSE